MAPFLAGASKYPPGRFVALAGFGTALWSAALVLLGYLFWQSLDEAIAIAQRGSLVLGGVVAGVVGLMAGYRYLRDRTGPGRSASTAGLKVRSEDSS